jgi:phage tail sheath protein FI
MPQDEPIPPPFVEELPGPPPAIAGVDTSVAAFLGCASAGPLDQAIRVGSFQDFERDFGGLHPRSELSYAVHQFFLNGGRDAWIVRVAGEDPDPALPPPGDDPARNAPLLGDPAQGPGLHALDAVALFNLLLIPGVSSRAVVETAAAYCETRQAFMIVDPPRTASSQDLLNLLQAGGLPRSRNAALYFPWIALDDPLHPGKARISAPSGSVAGVYVRGDTSRGVWKAPAGVEAHLVGAVALTQAVNDATSAQLNTRGVNPLRIMPAVGVVSWGARTLAGDSALNDDFKYVPVRRLWLYITASLQRGLQWTVFEANDPLTWSRVRTATEDFMNGLFRAGAFMGTKPSDAYQVICDGTTTTPDDMLSGIINLQVLFAPLRPAEFLVLQLQLHASV